MLLTLFALFTLHRARRGHPVTPPCLHNCALSAPFYTQPWEPDYTVHEASTQSALKLVCGALFLRGRVYDEWQISNVVLPFSGFGRFLVITVATTNKTLKDGDIAPWKDLNKYKRTKK